MARRPPLDEGVRPGEIVLEHASRAFSVKADRGRTLKEMLIGRQRAGGPAPVEALKDVSLRIEPGETVGMVGRNGAGKSSTLRVLSGIVPLNSGRVACGGQVVAQLELGAGFGRDFSGRENIVLNGAMHGLVKEQIEERLEAIIAFSELGDFIDAPVATYSSGMFLRLGFSIAAHLDADVLLIAEVLAVGDEAFQRKCLDRVRRFQREGRTIVLVTHALDTVREICDRAAMLHHGRLHALGAPDDVVREMRYVLLGVTDPGFVPEQGTREAEVVEVQLIRASGASDGPVLVGEPFTIQVDVRQNEPVDDLDVDFEILDGATNHPVLDARTSRAGADLGRFDKKRVRFRIDAFPYHAGKYWVTIGLSSRRTGHLYHVQTQRYLFEVVDAPTVQERLETPVHVEVDDL